MFLLAVARMSSWNAPDASVRAAVALASCGETTFYRCWYEDGAQVQCCEPVPREADARALTASIDYREAVCETFE